MNNSFFSTLKEEQGRLDQERLFTASSFAFESFERFFSATGIKKYHWLQHLAFPASCQHMCLAYKSIVLSMYLCPINGDTIYVSRDEINHYAQFRNSNQLTTVLIPISLETLQPIEDGLLLDPTTLQPIDMETINAENKVYVMSPWEVQTMAWFNVADYMNQNGYRLCEVTNIPELYPQIVAYTPEGNMCKVIIKAVSIGEKDDVHEYNVPMGSNFKDLEGYFVYVWFSNVYNTLDFNETYLLRDGGQFSSPIELIPLSEVSSRYPNIHLNISYFDTDEQ